MSIIKTKKKNPYYTLDNIKSKKALWNLIIGERSNGKTYSVLEEILKKHLATGEQGAIIRRWDTDFKQGRANQMWSSLVDNGALDNTEWTGITYRNKSWWLYSWDEETQTRVVAQEPLAYSFGLSATEHDKSTSYPKVKTILFDEFLSRTSYLPDEFVLLCNTVSTIVRQRDDVTIYMCGNTVSKNCPYFKEMGLNHIDKMEIGTIDVYEYGEGNTLAVEYCNPMSKDVKKSDKYFAFDNPHLNMIRNGMWETAIYPHLPIKYIPKDVKFTYYIAWEDTTLKADIVQKGNAFFTFIFEKNNVKINEDKELIFSSITDPRMNWRRDITSPVDKIGTMIYNFFKTDNVYYANNSVGETVRYYLQTCKALNVIKA